MWRSDSARFFQAWLKAPLRVASVMPSSRGLAGLITSEISPATGPVLELGPGTGVFTRALLARGVAEHDLSLVELDDEFVPLLRQRFPSARVLRMDAQRIGGNALFEGSRFGAIVSGLPLLSIPAGAVADILHGCLSVLEPAGAFYQFTYGPRCPVPREVLAHLQLQAQRLGRTFRNLPPASVYRILRAGAGPARLGEE